MITPERRCDIAYYRIFGRALDVRCGSAEQSGKCSGDCHKCTYCEVEDLKTGETWPWIGSAEQEAAERGEV